MKPMDGTPPGPPPTNPADGPHERSPLQPAWRYDPADLADLHAAGALTIDEQRELDDRIARGDAAMAQELQRVEPVIRAMLDRCEPIEPPARVIQGVLAQVRGDAPAPPARTEAGPPERPTSPLAELAGSVLRRAGEGRWIPTGLPGVWSKTLYRSRAENRVSMLVKCAPGAFIPHHDHEGIEELIVLEGDLVVGGAKLLAGDYIRTTPGHDHGDAYSESGCICLFFTSYGVMSNRSKFAMLVRVVRRWFGR